MTTTTKDNVKTYNAYNSRRRLTEDTELTHVDRGTPMGEYLRRFWQPIAHTQHVTDLPLKVRLLGEDLVLFRNGKGDYGLVEQRCSHRGASLEYGVISRSRVSAARTTASTTPPTARSSRPAPARRWPTPASSATAPIRRYVLLDLIFAYMGPPELKPPFPKLDLYTNPHSSGDRASTALHRDECNWLQIHENAMDPVHTAYLHAHHHRHAARLLRRWASSRDAVGAERNRDALHRQRAASSDLVWLRVLDVFMPNSG